MLPINIDADDDTSNETDQEIEVVYFNWKSIDLAIKSTSHMKFYFWIRTFNFTNYWYLNSWNIWSDDILMKFNRIKMNQLNPF